MDRTASSGRLLPTRPHRELSTGVLTSCPPAHPGPGASAFESRLRNVRAAADDDLLNSHPGRRPVLGLPRRRGLLRPVGAPLSLTVSPTRAAQNRWLASSARRPPTGASTGCSTIAWPSSGAHQRENERMPPGSGAARSRIAPASSNLAATGARALHHRHHGRGAAHRTARLELFGDGAVPQPVPVARWRSASTRPSPSTPTRRSAGASACRCGPWSVCATASSSAWRCRWRWRVAAGDHNAYEGSPAGQLGTSSSATRSCSVGVAASQGLRLDFPRRPRHRRLVAEWREAARGPGELNDQLSLPAEAGLTETTDPAVRHHSNEADDMTDTTQADDRPADGAVRAPRRPHRRRRALWDRGRPLRMTRAGGRLRDLRGADSIRGTWDLFRYPGIRSDSDTFTFSCSGWR